MVPLDSLKDVTDWAAIKKVGARLELIKLYHHSALLFQYHRLNGEPCIRNVKGGFADERARITNIVISSVATKNVLS